MTEKGNIVVDTTPNSVPIPADWKALGATTGYDPRKAEDLRFWIIGPNGEGKTTFEAGIPDQMILDFEGGANAIVGSRSIRIHIENYNHYKEVTDKLLQDAKDGKKHWKRISIDTADEWIGMIINQLQEEKNVEDITEYGMQGKGYNLILNRGWSMIRALENAGYVWSIVGHQRLKEETNPVTKQKVSRLRPSIFPGFARQIQGCSDFQVTIYCLNKSISKTKKRVIQGRTIEVPDGIEERSAYYVNALNTSDKEGKARGVPTMERKFEIPLVGGWNEFAKRYNEAVKKAKEKYGR